MSGDWLSLLALTFMLGLRFLGLLMVSPALTVPSMPIAARFWLALLLALAALPMVLGQAFPPNLTAPLALILACTREFFIGATLGFLSALPLYAMEMAGWLIGVSMGFGMVNVLDPLSQVQTSVIGQLKFLLGLWFFLHWNGHILLFQGLMESFRLFPLAQVEWSFAEDPQVATWLREAFYLAVKITLPFYGALLLADIGLGFIARTVPQLNVFILGLPLKVLLGFLMLMMVLPVAVDLIHGKIEDALELAMKGAALWH